jgi:diguanylate cyclase (GGDEF)-like protein
MRLISRNDLFLLFGLTVALFAIMSRPLAQVLDYAREIDQSWGLQLLPGLVILAVVFIFHQVRKRHEMRAEAFTAAADARQATARADEMERLVKFGQALGHSLNLDSIRDAAVLHLPSIVEGRDAWAMIRTAGEWRQLATVGNPAPDCEQTARRALGEVGAAAPDRREDVCFPMIAGGAPIGVLGVTPEPPIPEHQRIVLAAAAALLAVSLKNAELFQALHENSVRDSLTGCFNRHHALDVIRGELGRARRSHLPLSLIMLDLDHFKEINDRYGHLCGDAVLAAVGRQMNGALRRSDLKCRYGGEEFLIVLPDTMLSGAQHVAEMLRRDFEEHPVRWNLDNIRVTASFGVTAISPGETDPTALIARADAALYRAKQQGRNCVCVADEPAEVTNHKAQVTSHKANVEPL